MKTTKLTPRSNRAVIASSLEINTVMGLMEANFIGKIAWEKAGYLKRYPAQNRIFRWTNETYRCSDLGMNQLSAKEKNLYG